MHAAPQTLAPRTGPINRGIDPCFDCAAAPGQRHTNICALSPADPAWSSAPFAFAPWFGSIEQLLATVPETNYRRACDDCSREWVGALPSSDEVHIWYCPWCETRLSGRSIVWRQLEDDSWVMVIGKSDDFPWVGPLRRAKEA